MLVSQQKSKYANVDVIKTAWTVYSIMQEQLLIKRKAVRVLQSNIIMIINKISLILHFHVFHFYTLGT
jgi:hypothetical protein